MKIHNNHIAPIIVFFLTLGIVSSASAQENVITSLPRMMGSLSGMIAFPQKPIQKHLDPQDWGYTIDLMYRIQYNKPFMAGLSFSEQWLSARTNKYREVYNGIELNLKERAITRRLEVMALFGFYPETNTLVQPYLLGRAGWGKFRTTSIIYDNDEIEELERIKEHRDHTLAYGMDVGVHIVPNIWYLRFDARLGFRSNISASFMAYDSSIDSGSNYPIHDFSLFTSAANWLTASVGATILF